MLPAVAAMVIAMLCVLGLLCLTSGAFARALTEHRTAASAGAAVQTRDTEGECKR